MSPHQDTSPISPDALVLGYQVRDHHLPNRPPLARTDTYAQALRAVEQLHQAYRRSLAANGEGTAGLSQSLLVLAVGHPTPLGPVPGLDQRPGRPQVHPRTRRQVRHPRAVRGGRADSQAIVRTLLVGWLLGLLIVLAGGLGGIAAFVAVQARYRQGPVEAEMSTQIRREQHLARELDLLRPLGWTVLHDRLAPGTEHRLAQVLAGPGGLVVATVFGRAGVTLTSAPFRRSAFRIPSQFPRVRATCAPSPCGPASPSATAGRDSGD